MKFIIAVVLLSSAICAQAGLLPLSYVAAPLSYTAVSGPTQNTIAAGAYRYPVAVSAYHVRSPILVDYSVPLPSVFAGQGSYIAQNRGAVHIAPLEGHANSVASINLDPAPGTF